MPKLKLTNEAVARKLGWKLGDGTRAAGRALWTNGFYSNPGVPDFIGSLDVITSEISARGLGWATTHDGWGKVWNPKLHAGARCPTIGDGPTATLALCAALIGYLKESK